MRNKILLSELESRAEDIAAGLQSLSDIVKKSLPTKESLKTSVRSEIEDGNYVVTMERTNTVQGSQRMLSLGQGVKARLGKDSDGKTIVEAFYFDRNRYTEEKVEEWLEKNSQKIFESSRWIQMQAPKGCFEDTAMRVQVALNSSDVLMGASVRVEFVFPEKVIVSSYSEPSQMWELPYSDNGVEITFGEPVKISVELVKEKIAEYNKRADRHSAPNSVIEGERMKIVESKFKVEEFKKSRELPVVLIEAGSNYNKRRHYPKKTIQESAPIFAGLKMYIDHPTESEEAEKPERSIKDWVSTIKESWYEDGKAMGMVHIHDPWLFESMQDPVFRSEIGISINASGRAHMGEIDGMQMQIMDSIVGPKSVDWVTEAGARGRVEQLLESQRIEREKKEIKDMDLKTLKETNKALYDAVAAEVRESMKGETDQKIKEAVDKAIAQKEKEIKEAAEKESRVAARKQKVTETVAGSKLPEKARARFVDSFLRENAETKDEEIESKIKESIMNEIKYLNDLGAGIKINVDSGKKAGEAGVVESATAEIIESAGLVDKKKDEDEE